MYEAAPQELPPSADQVVSSGQLIELAFASIFHSHELRQAGTQLGVTWYERSLKQRCLDLAANHQLPLESTDAQSHSGIGPLPSTPHSAEAAQFSLAMRLRSEGSVMQACALFAERNIEWLPVEPLEWLLHRLKAFNYSLYSRHYQELLRCVLGVTPEPLRFGLTNFILSGRKGLLALPKPPEGRSRESYEARTRDNALRALAAISHFTEVRILLRRHAEDFFKLVGPQVNKIGSWADCVKLVAPPMPAQDVMLSGADSFQPLVVHTRVWSVLLKEVRDRRGKPLKLRATKLAPDQSIIRVTVTNKHGKRIGHICSGLYKPTSEIPVEAVKTTTHVYCRDIGHVRVHLLRCAMQR